MNSSTNHQFSGANLLLVSGRVPLTFTCFDATPFPCLQIHGSPQQGVGDHAQMGLSGKHLAKKFGTETSGNCIRKYATKYLSPPNSLKAIYIYTVHTYKPIIIYTTKNHQGIMFPSPTPKLIPADPSAFNCGISFRKVAMARKVLLRSSNNGTNWTTGRVLGLEMAWRFERIH